MQIDYIHPASLCVGFFRIYIYPLMWGVGIILASIVFMLEIRRSKGEPISFQSAPNLVLLTFFSGVIGARIGYLLLNEPLGFLSDPILLISPRLGGMNFHGAAFAMILMGLVYSRFKIRTFLQLADIGALCLPPMLMCVRIGNYFNGELFGTVTTLPWGTIFDGGGQLTRHPTQIYEALLEGPILFSILWLLRTKARTPGEIWSVFLIGYGLTRLMIEFIQEPITRIIPLFAPLTIGQILCICRIILGIVILVVSKRFYSDGPKSYL